MHRDTDTDVRQHERIDPTSDYPHGHRSGLALCRKHLAPSHPLAQQSIGWGGANGTTALSHRFEIDAGASWVQSVGL